MKVCIDIDDYHTFPRWDCTDILLRLISEFPHIKFSIFFTPFMKRIPLTDYPQALDRLREMIHGGSVEVFPHGLTHRKFINGEFGGVPRCVAKRRITRAFDLLEKAQIPCGKGFKFPWNLYNDASLQVLEERGYTLFTNRREKRFKGEVIIWKNYRNVMKRYIQPEDYRHGKPEPPDAESIVYYHSHAQNVRKTGIREGHKNLIKELKELERIAPLEFIFCSQINAFVG